MFRRNFLPLASGSYYFIEIPQTYRDSTEEFQGIEEGKTKHYISRGGFANELALQIVHVVVSESVSS
jgi:hypothetical protein